MVPSVEGQRLTVLTVPTHYAAEIKRSDEGTNAFTGVMGSEFLRWSMLWVAQRMPTCTNVVLGLVFFKYISAAFAE